LLPSSGKYNKAKADPNLQINEVRVKIIDGIFSLTPNRFPLKMMFMDGMLV
jgi:hypothetical protein